MLYPIAIIQKNGQYHGRFPDLPELEVTASNMADIISDARQKVIDHLQALAEKDRPIPEDSDVADYLASEEYAGWIWAIISIDASRIIGEAVEVTISIPERLMQKINKYVSDSDTSIEAFFIESVKRNFL